MRTVFYIKEGEEYIPISEYDDNFLSSLAYGDHLLSIYPGGSSRRKITPAFAPLIAAGRYAREPITSALANATKWKLSRNPVTPEQEVAWEALNKAFGETSQQLTWQSASDVAEDAINAMIKESEMLLLHPTVRHAYEEFMLVCKLSKEQND